MEHFYSRDNMHQATPIVAHSWVGEGSPLPGEIQTGVSYKKTRSTLAVDAIDVLNLDTERTVAAFQALIQICKIVDRDEIVVECLDEVAIGEGDQSISACFNSIQSDIIQTSRKLNMNPPRISLEKRGQHFDLRIYLSFL